jgi:type I restriction enzyme M protein
MKKSLGSKRNELVPRNINDITKLYLDFEATEFSKIFDNNEFGYAQIIVHRPLRLMVQFTAKKVASLRFVSNNAALREELYKEFGNEVYHKKTADKLEQWLLNYFMQNNDDDETEDGDVSTGSAEITLASLPKKKQKIVKQLIDTPIWQRDLDLMNHAKLLAEHFGDKLFDDFNVFEEKFEKELKRQNIKLTAKEKKDLLGAVSWTDPKAAAVIKKKNKDGSIEYVSDPALKDYENIPLKEDILTFFEREVIPFANDAWWNKDETKIGFEINFNKYFYQYTPPRSKEEIAADLFAIEQETENLLHEILEL